MASHHYLGVDYGEKRIGLALASDDLRVARPLEVVEPGHQSVTAVIRALVPEYAITDIVVGLPRSLDGGDTAQTQLVRRFASELEGLGLPVILQDEAVTSEVARAQQPANQQVDAAAAAIILQDYLESL